MRAARVSQPSAAAPFFAATTVRQAGQNQTWTASGLVQDQTHLNVTESVASSTLDWRICGHFQHFNFDWSMFWHLQLGLEVFDNCNIWVTLNNIIFEPINPLNHVWYQLHANARMCTVTWQLFAHTWRMHDVHVMCFETQTGQNRVATTCNWQPAYFSWTN